MDATRCGTRPYRLGAFLDGLGWVEYQYGNVWAREDNRLIAAPDGNQVDLILKLAEAMEEPFQVAYILLVPREDGQDEGRFELTAPLTYDALAAFLWRYRKLFEEDGRHHLHISSDLSGSSIVYDQHNVLYLYGQTDRAVGVLNGSGLSEGQVDFPSPHSHHYHGEMDSLLDDMLERYDWKCYPLS
jgi:hypothetical protein